MLKHKNRIIGVIFICIVSFLLCFETLAEDANANVCKGGNADNIQARYDLTLEKVDEYGNYRIRMAGAKNDLDDAEFAVVGIGKYQVSKDRYQTGGTLATNPNDIAHITKNQAAEFKAIPDTDESESILAVEVKMVKGKTESNCDYYETLLLSESGKAITTTITNATELNKSWKGENGSICYNFYNGIWSDRQFSGNVKKADFDTYHYKAVAGKDINGTSVQEVYNSVLQYCNQQYVTYGAQYTEAEVADIIGNAITYVKTQLRPVAGGSQTFGQLYNDIKTKALAAGNNKTGKEAKATSLKCNWQISKESIKADYYNNKDYFYKEETGDPISVTYKYHYAPGDVKTETKNVCQKTCAEAVKVEYGPPVASKAGLCFEYKVKVTSYVECDANVTLEPPKQETTYCSPEPWCHEKNYRWEGNFAGPTEEFETCIQDCDGGKYTSACSVKCYKKVYKNSKIKLAINYENLLPEKMTSYEDYTVDQCINESSDNGCYYWNGDSIYWKSSIYENDTEKTNGFSKNKNALGRWYRAAGKDSLSVGYKTYAVSSNGIKTRQYSTGNFCNDVCYWKTTTCKKGMYLNPSSITDDYKDNLKAYQSAVSQCKAAATCSNKTAEFTISINYKEEGKSEVTTVNYPYSNKIDTIPSLGKDEKGNPATGVNTTKNSNTTILDHNGCYKEADERNWYLTEWSFPGTYIHNKSGKISFGVPDDKSGWYYEDKKFCIPLNVQSVSTKWWEWYEIQNSQFTCYTADQIKNNIEYNITAKAKNFGYFGWDFTVNCFYAIKNEICNINKAGCCGGCPPDKVCAPTSKYTVRTVDLDNLFPNAKAAGAIDDEKRDIGFNWTSKAASEKNADYRINPTQLIDDIQNNASTIYSSKPDYQFYLTPKDLANIKKDNNKQISADNTGGYSAFGGKSKVINGITTYSSDLFRSGGIIKAKELGTIGVNNQ